MLKDKQKSAKTLPQRLAGLNKGRSAWGENLACGVAWQSVLLGRSGAWQGALNSAKCNTAWRSEFGNETAQRGKMQRHSKASTANSMWQTFAGKTANSAWQAGRKWCLQAKQSVAERQIQHRENGAVLAGEVGKAKMGQCLGGGLLSLSLSLSLSLVARTCSTPLG